MQEQNTEQNHHGLAMYIAESFQSKVMNLPVAVRMEVLCVAVSVSPEFSSNVILLYRSPSISQVLFFSDLNSILTYVERNQVNISVLMGDFNVNALNQVASSALIRTMNRFGWKQMVTKATHRSGSCLDHIYIHQSSYGHVSVLPSYFSDHHCVHLQLISAQDTMTTVVFMP